MSYLRKMACGVVVKLNSIAVRVIANQTVKMSYVRNAC